VENTARKSGVLETIVFLPGNRTYAVLFGPAGGVRNTALMLSVMEVALFFRSSSFDSEVPHAKAFDISLGSALQSMQGRAELLL